MEIGPQQIEAMNDLKDAIKSPALQPIDYKSDAAVILSVDTSHIVIGFLLSQCDLQNPRLRYYAKFGLITLNECKACFSWVKLELYGLYRTLRALKPLLIGIQNLIVEVDAKYIQGMLRNPDIVPSASINRWIVSILLFHFMLVHMPGSHHGPDGLSRQKPQQDDEKEPEEDDGFKDWVDRVNSVTFDTTIAQNKCNFQDLLSLYSEQNPINTCNLLRGASLVFLGSIDTSKE